MILHHYNSNSYSPSLRFCDILCSFRLSCFRRHHQNPLFRRYLPFVCCLVFVIPSSSFRDIPGVAFSILSTPSIKCVLGSCDLILAVS
ncbi:hypothetical protein DL93DRAFT_1736799 [Clavulina sp. PMI_390]|nr:hypothetical protein DL93DRAFT_1736799 [Clavulina sp. PMI_390]